ncbi:MAG TPA: hypothetical protein VGB49_01835 [Caulobacteraceae bacterium]|jgi:hypothetical protein
MRLGLIAVAALVAGALSGAVPASAQERASCSADPSRCSDVQQRTERFRDNDSRRAEMELRERQVAQARAQYAARMALAEELDALLTAGRCPDAVTRARAGGYADIAAAVERTCAGPPPASAAAPAG